MVAHMPSQIGHSQAWAPSIFKTSYMDSKICLNKVCLCIVFVGEHELVSSYYTMLFSHIFLTKLRFWFSMKEKIYK